MRKRLLDISLLVFSLACVNVASASSNLRCDNLLVVTGDTRDVVRNRCGAPADISTSVISRRVSVIGYGRSQFNSANKRAPSTYSPEEEQVIEVPVETWVYNFGPNRFMQRLRFVDGVLDSIEALGYGYSNKE